MSVSLHRIHEGRNDRLESLAADPIRSLPQDRQCLHGRFVVDPRPFWLRSDGMRAGLPQGADGMLSMKTCDLDELIEDSLLLNSPSRVIAARDSFDQFPSCSHAELPPDSVVRHVVL